MKRVVILGAGVAGLAAADRLLELGGCDVTMFEAEPGVGGLAATVVRDGVATDLGPHRIHTELSEVRALLPDLVGDRLLRVRRSSRMLLDGHWIAYPLRAGQILKTLGFGTVLRFGTSMLAARASGFFARQAGSLFYRRRASATFEDAMKRAFGAAAYRKVFGPYARKVWRVEPSQLSAEIVRVRLPQRRIGAIFGRALRRGLFRSAGPLREFLYVRGGIGQLCERLSDRIRQRGGRITLQSPVVEMKIGSTGVCAVAARQSGKTIWLDVDAVISTVPLPVLGAMMPVGEAAVRAALSSLEYLSIILVVLVAAKERIGPDQWLYFPQESPLPTRACEPRNFDSSLAPPGQTCLCCEITARRSESLWNTPDDKLAEQVEHEMAATGLFARQEIISRFVVRKDWAYPIYHLGFEKTLATIWPFLARIPNLVSVGRQGLFNHNNIDHSLVMGRRAAEAVATSPSAAHQWYDSLFQFAHFRILD